MTQVSVPAGVKKEPMTVTVDWYDRVDSGHAELLKRINIVLGVQINLPIVNREPWTARVIIKWFGGEIISEPEFDPDAGDVVSNAEG
jgi:hypothetical protein